MSSTMEQPLFSCAKCFRNFPQSEMSRTGQTCKSCNPHHSTFKQCEYCKADFKYYIYGVICPRCQSLKSKYGEPQPCSICRLKTAFGNALVCQRCLHYRMRFGEPRECQSCGQVCAFLKDEASRQKVDGQVLCWVCTYNFKLARSRERSDHGINKRRSDDIDQSRSKNERIIESQQKRTRPDGYMTPTSEPTAPETQKHSSINVQNIDSVYNEHILTISQLQDDVKNLKRQLAIKDADLLSKDRTIAELKSEMIDMKSSFDDRLMKAKAAAQLEQDRLMVVIKQLQKEKIAISQEMRKRKSGVSSYGTPSTLRHSSSSVALFNPDSPIIVASGRGRKHKPQSSENPGPSENPGKNPLKSDDSSKPIEQYITCESSDRAPRDPESGAVKCSETHSEGSRSPTQDRVPASPENTRNSSSSIPSDEDIPSPQQDGW